MTFWRQTTTLVCKNLLILGKRQWLPTALRAVVLPIAFIIFLSYVRTFFLPPGRYGVGDPRPIRDLLTEVFPSPPRGRNRIVFSTNGNTMGYIPQLIDAMKGPLVTAGADVRVIEDENDLTTLCRSSLRGVSRCYAAASFVSAPSTANASEPWVYTLYNDYALGFTSYVNKDNNDAQVITLPFMHYIDTYIGALINQTMPSQVDALPFTTTTQEQQDGYTQEYFMRALLNYLSTAFFLGMCGITFHLPGFIASERELGMSQLIDSMVPNSRQIVSQIARVVAAHLAFDLIYIVSWIAIGAIVATSVFVLTSTAAVLFFHILTGFALSGFSTFGASFFRKSQLSGITVLIISLVTAVAAQVAPLASSSAVYVLSFLFPSAAYVFFLASVAEWEVYHSPAEFSISSPWSFVLLPGQVYFIALTVQIICYPLLAILVEHWRFGTSSKHRIVRSNATTESAAIKISNFHKQYKPRSRRDDPVKAVNDLNLTILAGETMVLLGANGCGKSTTLDAVSGITTPTAGLIEVDGSGGIGLCPQKNVMWSNLTVREHIWIFERLKAKVKASDTSHTDDLIRVCDLSGKDKKKAGALSGGQKRKLQLAIAFAGASRVCCIDEVSSGLDPLSRRKIWDILVRERGKRTLLFTTHALDEADALADHVAIMSQGHLKVQGSVVELKHTFGGGYKVIVPGTLDLDLELAGPYHIQQEVSATGTILKAATSEAAFKLVQTLKQRGNHDFQVNAPTIEDVFLEVVEEGKEELSSDPRDSLPASAQMVHLPSTATHHMEQPMKGAVRSILGQAWVLLRKRFLILTRNYIPYFCALVIPLITAGLTTYLLADYDGGGCRIIDTVRLGGYLDWEVSGARYQQYTFGPTSNFSPQQWPPTYDYLLNSTTDLLRFADTFDAFRPTVDYTAYPQPLGGLWVGSVSNPTLTLSYQLDNGVYWAIFAKEIMDSYLLNTNIVVRFSTFALPAFGKFGDSLQVCIYFGLAMSAYPAFFALYPTFERIRNVRALHYSNGIRAESLWLAYGIFDCIFVLLVSIAVTIMWTTITNAFFQPGYLFVVFFLFGTASTLLSYIVSNIASSQLAAFAFAAGGQAVFLLIYFICYIVLISFSIPDSLNRNLNAVQFTLGLITPSGNLLRALLLALNQSQLLCREEGRVTYAGDITVYGGPIFYLTLQILAFYAFLVAYDNHLLPRLAFWRKGTRATDDEKSADDVAVQEVNDEVARTEESDDALRVLHLDKSFGAETAVKDVTFGVQHGEVFTLLGPNGAGKSTTISLIRGDIKPSTDSSNIFVEGTSIVHSRTLARRNLGVCPQFDAVDRLTVAEHLTFYGRATGVADVKANVDHVITATGLDAFRDRLADQLSGGNKRKLSLAISIIGNPSVLLLDEPSSGMDAISKRIMWKLLRTIKQGRSLVLTTHSMEEASALGDRAGIMAKRMLIVGTTGHLRKTHGNGYYVHLMHKDAPTSTPAQESRLQEWMHGVVPAAESIGGSMLHGQLRYHVPSRRVAGTAAVAQPVSMTDMLRLLEENKDDLEIGFYSVSPTTLEDVFLNIVGSHGVEEEESQRWESSQPVKASVSVVEK